MNNQTCELSLRCLIILSDGYVCSADRLVVYDYIITHARDYDFGQDNLLDDCEYKKSSYVKNMSLIEESINYQVLLGNVRINMSDDGFTYEITKVGYTYINQFNDDFYCAYKKLAKHVLEKYCKYDDLELQKIMM